MSDNGLDSRVRGGLSPFYATCTISREKIPRLRFSSSDFEKKESIRFEIENLKARHLYGIRTAIFLGSCSIIYRAKQALCILLVDCRYARKLGKVSNRARVSL